MAVNTHNSISLTTVTVKYYSDGSALIFSCTVPKRSEALDARIETMIHCSLVGQRNEPGFSK